ncbi:MAG: prepilin-type N-terminal cleavage/methylation domain-containing protein [Phycisphaerales bacterium]
MNRHGPQRGFTLLEVMAAVVVLSIIVVVVFPVVQTLLSSHAAGVSERRAIDRVSYAIDRVVREIREIGIDDAGSAELAVMDADELIEAGGAGVRLVGTDLRLVDSSGDEHPLCENVTAFTLDYVAADGLTTASGVADVWTIRITLVADGVELRSVAFIRERVGGAS